MLVTNAVPRRVSSPSPRRRRTGHLDQRVDAERSSPALGASDRPPRHTQHCGHVVLSQPRRPSSFGQSSPECTPPRGPLRAGRRRNWGHDWGHDWGHRVVTLSRNVSTVTGWAGLSLPAGKNTGGATRLLGSLTLFSGTVRRGCSTVTGHPLGVSRSASLDTFRLRPTCPCRSLRINSWPSRCSSRSICRASREEEVRFGLGEGGLGRRIRRLVGESGAVGHGSHRLNSPATATSHSGPQDGPEPSWAPHRHGGGAGRGDLDHWWRPTRPRRHVPRTSKSPRPSQRHLPFPTTPYQNAARMSRGARRRGWTEAPRHRDQAGLAARKAVGGGGAVRALSTHKAHRKWVVREHKRL